MRIVFRLPSRLQSLWCPVDMCRRLPWLRGAKLCSRPELRHAHLGCQKRPHAIALRAVSEDRPRICSPLPFHSATGQPMPRIHFEWLRGKGCSVELANASRQVMGYRALEDSSRLAKIFENHIERGNPFRALEVPCSSPPLPSSCEYAGA